MQGKDVKRKAVWARNRIKPHEHDKVLLAAVRVEVLEIKALDVRKTFS